jgi:hypothetical protein
MFWEIALLSQGGNKMNVIRAHWLALVLVGVYLFFANTNGYWPFANGTGSFSLTTF